MVSNLGLDTALEVQVEDRLPAGSVFVSATGAGWSCIEAGGVVNCYRPTLAAGVSAAIQIAARAPAQVGAVSNTAAVRSTAEDGAVDNNVSVVEFQVDGTDNCPLVRNPNQADSDRDGIGDACNSSGFCWSCLPSRGGWRTILR